MHDVIVGLTSHDLEHQQQTRQMQRLLSGAEKGNEAAHQLLFIKGTTPTQLLRTSTTVRRQLCVFKAPCASAATERPLAN
jgi:hypothetical protein